MDFTLEHGVCSVQVISVSLIIRSFGIILFFFFNIIILFLLLFFIIIKILIINNKITYIS